MKRSTDIVVQRSFAREAPRPEVKLGTMQVQELIQDFLIYGHQRGYSETTQNSYRFAIADFLDFFKDADLQAIRAADIREWQKWLLSRGLSPDTMNARLCGIRAFLDQGGPARPSHQKRRPTASHAQPEAAPAEISFTGRNDAPDRSGANPA